MTTASKLTFHFQGLGGEVANIAQASEAAWIKVIDPPAEHPFPGKRIIGRTYLDDGEANALVAMGELGAQIWFSKWLPIYQSRSYVALWEGPNEPQPIHDATFRRQLVAFTLRWAELMHGIGRQVAGLCLSVGCPDIPEFSDLLPVIGHVDAIASHEYSAPAMQDGASWYCLRYRRFFGIIRQAGLAVPRWFITEAGIDGGVLTPPRAKTGWKTFTDVAGYMEQLAWYDGELRKDPEIVAATVFTACPNSDWYDFEITTDLAQRMAAHMAATQVPPPTPQPLPEHEPDGPASFLAEKVRWWMEEEVRMREAGNTARANAIAYSLIKLDNGLLYRLERQLKAANAA